MAGQPPVECLRILVVEDHPDTADTLARLLRAYGHSVEVANEAATALALVTEHAPDVAILDIGLPGMNGFELARRLRALAEAAARRPFLIAATGYGSDDDRAASKAAGIDLHLVKPVDPKELERLLARFRQVLCP